MYKTGQVIFPGSNARISPFGGHKGVKGGGYGTVLLDGGMGSASSYNGIDDYIKTTHTASTKPVGRGLADKINDKLGKLNINTSKPKVKNITFSI